MTQKTAGALAMAALLLVCGTWTLPKSMAEPIIPAVDAGTPAGAGAQPQEVTDAIGRFNARDFEGALLRLREAVKKNADLPPAQVIMAQLYARANIPALARNALEQAVLEEPADPEAYMFIADRAVRERRATEAEMVYQKAESLLLKFNKSAKRKGILQAGVCSGLAQVNEARDNWAEAKKQLETWLKIDPTSVAAMQRLAQCLVRQKDLTGALAELRKAAKADPQMLNSEALLARLCEQAGDHENAKKYMALALTAAPKDPKTCLSAAQWAFETGQLELAQAQAAAAMKLDEKSLEAKLLRSLIALFQKDYGTAERYFEEAHLQSPDNFLASNNLALALAEQNDEAKKRRALAYAEANARQFPNSADAASTYGWVLYQLGRLEDADRALRAALSGGSSSPDTAYYLARVDVDRNQPSEAKLLLENALKSTGPFSMRPEAKALLERLRR